MYQRKTLIHTIFFVYVGAHDGMVLPVVADFGETVP